MLPDDWHCPPPYMISAGYTCREIVKRRIAALKQFFADWFGPRWRSKVSQLCGRSFRGEWWSSPVAAEIEKRSNAHELADSLNKQTQYEKEGNADDLANSLNDDISPNNEMLSSSPGSIGGPDDLANRLNVDISPNDEMSSSMNISPNVHISLNGEMSTNPSSKLDESARAESMPPWDAIDALESLAARMGWSPATYMHGVAYEMTHGSAGAVYATNRSIIVCASEPAAPAKIAELLSNGTTRIPRATKPVLPVPYERIS